MKTGIIGKILGHKPRPEKRLIAVTPERTGDHSLSGVESLLNSIAIPEPFSLELAGDTAGVTLLARCREGSFVKQQVGAFYPQARISEVPPESDPLRLAEGEQAWSINLRLRGPEYLPLRVFKDDHLREPGSDPLVSLIGAMSDLGEGERLVARIRLLSLGPDWARHHQERAQQRQQSSQASSPSDGQHQFDTKQGASFILLAATAGVGLQGYFWVQNGETWKAVLLGLGVAAGLALAGWAWWRIKRFLNGDRPHDPLLIKEKVTQLGYDAQVEVIAALSEHGDEGRAREMLRNAALAYQGYDNPAGASFKAGKVRPVIPETEPFPPARSMWQSRNVLGVRELASLWHPLGSGNQPAGVTRSGSRILSPSAKATSAGVYLGDTVGSRPRKVHLPEDAIRRNQFLVARTRMGKSTLMHHVVTHLMREKAAGRNEDAIIVVDPHADLVKDLLQQVPESIVDNVYLIDLANDAQAPGINLLDTRVFPDRDRTADSVVQVAHGLWEQWGPRMQSILEHTIKSLHEYNRHPDTGEDEQLTILDGSRMLSDRKFRNKVLLRVEDPYIVSWWGSVFLDWTRTIQTEAISPVQTRLAYYSSSKKARAILGQRRSTLDIREVIAKGGVLLVSTAQGDVGKDVSALVGASLLNLVDSVIREQGRLPQNQRRGALVVVDEMTSIPGVDYESMLSELGKFGASFMLATQSLGRLEKLSPTLQDTLLANVGNLAVFQVAAADAQELIGELDRDRVSEEDLVSLPVHHCYVRATVDGQREPTYSLAVRRPEPGDEAVAERVKARAVDYTTSAETLASLDAEAERLVKEFRDRVKQENEEADSGNTGQDSNQGKGKGSGGSGGKGKKGRRRRKEPDPDPEPNPSEGEGE